MGRGHSGRQYGQFRPRRKPAESPHTVTTEGLLSGESTTEAPTDKQMSFSELPHDIIGYIMFKLPFGSALALGSTCHTTHQNLQTLRPDLTQQLLDSDELKPKVQLASVLDSWPTSIFPIYAHWDMQASWMLFNLAAREQVSPDLLWTSVAPKIPVKKSVQNYLSVRCSFGCIEWVSGSLYKQGEELHLYKRMAHSDLRRMETHFSALKDCLVANGVRESSVSVTICKGAPHVDRQRDAALVVHWLNGHMQTKSTSELLRNSLAQLW